MAWLFSQTRRGGRRHPGRAARLLARLSLSPPANVVRVVGTNGKGTVTAMISAGLAASGLKVGRFLSPHVEDFRERIAVDGEPIAAARVVDFVDRYAGLPSEDPDTDPSFFEWTLAMALAEFARRRATWGVFEAGVGGSSDATQVLNGPNLRLVVLTNVTPDHVDSLGPTLADIARDKAGAAAPGVALLTAASGEALEVANATAASLGAAVRVVDVADAATTRVANEGLAVAALELLGFPQPARDAALALPPLPGRGERFRIDGRQVVLDGAHDPAAAARLASEHEGGYTLLFGALARKQATATLSALLAGASAVVLTSAAAGEPVVRPPAGLAHESYADPGAALGRALALTPVGGTVLIAGSLYAAGRLRPLLTAALEPAAYGRC